MKNKKIKWVIVSVALVLVASVMIFFAVKNHNSSDKASTYGDGDITRFEWIEMLCTYTGAEDYSNEMPYFQDVTSGNEYFSYVQSAVEWEYILEDSEFAGDDIASGKFIAMSAVKSAGEVKLQIYLGEDEEISDDEYLEVALENGIIEESDLKRGFSSEEAETVLRKLDDLFYETFWSTDVEEITYQEDVIELDESEVVSYEKDTEEITISNVRSGNLSVGDIIIFKHNGFVVARKISAVSNGGNYTLEIPELEEVINSLVESDVKELSFNDIVNFYGEENLIVAENISSDKFMKVSKTISGEAQYKGFSIEAKGNSSQELEIYVTDNNTGIKYQLPISKELSDGYENLDVEIDIDSIFVGSQIKYSAKLGVEYAELAVDIHSDISGGIAMDTDTDDRILLFETPTPLGCGAIGVDIGIYLVTSLEGEISLEAEIPFQNTVHYEKGKGIRNIKHEISVSEPRVEASGELDVKVRVAPLLIICEIVPVLDAEFDAGVAAKATVTLRDNLQVCTDLSAAFPVVEVSVGDEDVLYHGMETVLAKIHITGNWEIISFDDAPKKFGLHFEMLPDGTKQFVEKCTYKEGEGEDNKKDETPINMSNTYTTRESEVYAVTCPVFQFDYSDNWSVIKEELHVDNYITEVVTIANERGVEITYVSLGVADTTDGGRTMYEVNVAKEEASSFIPGYISGTDIDVSDMGNFMVAKIKVEGALFMDTDLDYTEVDGGVSYAVLPESYVGARSEVRYCGYYTGFSFIYFNYPAPIAFFAESPDGKFTKEEEKEVIAILSSFRVR